MPWEEPVRKQIKKKAAMQGCCDEGGVQPLGACYTAPRSPGWEQKQLDQTSMNEGGSRERLRATTAGSTVSRNLYIESGRMHHRRLTAQKKGEKRRWGWSGGKGERWKRGVGGLAAEARCAPHEKTSRFKNMNPKRFNRHKLDIWSLSIMYAVSNKSLSWIWRASSPFLC